MVGRKSIRRSPIPPGPRRLPEGAALALVGMASVRSGLSLKEIPGEAGMSMAEIAVPPRFAGRSMQELDVHRRFEVTVLLIKRKSGAGDEEISLVPDADFVFREGDRMLVMGAERHLKRLERETR